MLVLTRNISKRRKRRQKIFLSCGVMIDAIGITSDNKPVVRITTPEKVYTSHGEPVWIGTNIQIEPHVWMQTNQIRIGITAPRSINIVREELLSLEDAAKLERLARGIAAGAA